MNKKEYKEWLITGVEDGWIYVDKNTWNEYLKAKKEVGMNKKRYKINVPVGWIMGHLRYGHFEGIVELTDKTVEVINSGGINRRDFCREYLDLIIGEYRVDDYGDIELEEIKDV